MAQHDYIIANQSGAAFRSDLNNGLAAAVSNNSGAAQPSTTYAYMWWPDTTTGLLKIRNAANNAWITVGTLADANLGLATLASPTFSGTATFGGNVLLSGTGVLDLPVGTTAERPGSPNSGMIRFNSSLTQFEGYNGTEWGQISIGGQLCRAWVNFNGTGVVAIRASHNVSSITDNGTNDYTVNFATAMEDANYVVAATAGGASGSGFNRTTEDVTARTSSVVRLYTNADAPQVNIAIFR